MWVTNMIGVTQMGGKVNLTIHEIQGHLNHISKRESLTSEEKYSLSSAIETMEFLKRLSPGLKKVVDAHRKNALGG